MMFFSIVLSFLVMYCRWFDEMDAWNSKRASVHNKIPASAQEGSETCSTPPTTPEIFQPSPSTAPPTSPSTQKKKKDSRED